MPQRNGVSIRELGRDEIERILARNNVGRIAYSFRDRVDIEPLHYAYADGWLYGRTSHGTKFADVQHNRWVAFEVDEVDGVFSWRSVVVHGALYVLSEDRPPREIQAWRRAVELLREIIPETFTDDDPVSERTAVFRIHAD